MSLPRSHAATSVAILGGGAAVAAGMVTLLGWAFEIERLTDWFGTSVSMMPNAALAAAAAGAAVLLLASRPRVAAAFAAVCAALSGLTLLQHLTGADFGIDRIVFPREWGQHATVVPGRMGLPASTVLTLLGGALLLAAVRPRARQLAALAFVAAAAIVSLAIVGYLYGANLLIALPRLTAISSQTAVVLTLLIAGAFAALPEVQPTRALLGTSTAATLVRRALPFTLLVPLAVGWLRVEGQRAGHYDLAFGSALRTIVECSLLLGLLAWTATAVRRHERSLADSRKRLEGILASISDHFVAIDRDGRLTHCNRAARDLLEGHEIDAEDLLGIDVLARHPALAALPAVQKLRDATARGVAVELDAEAAAWQRWFAVRGAPTPDGGFAIIAQDVTERRRLERELRERVQQLHDADSRKDEFLATLAHELRNPLAPIRNMLEVLRRGGSGAEAVQQARAIMERQLRHLTRLIDDLLDVSRISTGRIVLRMGRTALGTVVQHALDGAAPAIAAARHRLTVVVPPEPVFVHGDPIRLAQIVGNLLDNACKYTEPGGNGHVALRVVVEQDGVTIRVQDNGVGVPEGMLTRIFDMFTQVDRTVARAQEGLGIGLSLVKRLVEMHGGSVRAHSPGLGEGCEIVVRLPLAGAAAESAAPAREAPLVRGCRILVVDDNRDAAASLAMLLELSGNTVQTANDGLDAVQAAATFHPDVVLLDIGMPKMDGYEVARRLRAAPRGSQLVIVAVTGWGQEQDRRKATDAGFDAHLVKPLEPDALMQLLDRLLPPRLLSTSDAEARTVPRHG